MKSDAAFTGSIPAIYDRCLGPLLFDPHAADLAKRVAKLSPKRILETAAGTGIVTAALIDEIPGADIVATDLNQAMLDVAATKIRSERVTFQAADAQALPFGDASFDAVVCQFGFMFFPDRHGAYQEARRVLRNGGTLLFNVWDRLPNNPVSATIAAAVAEQFPADPPSFLDRVPFGYADTDLVTRELNNAGFADVQVETVKLTSRSSTAAAAQGMCHGSPLRSEIEACDATRLDEVTAAAAASLFARYGSHEFEEAMSAHVISATA